MARNLLLPCPRFPHLCPWQTTDIGQRRSVELCGDAVRDHTSHTFPGGGVRPRDFDEDEDEEVMNHTGAMRVSNRERGIS